MHPILMRRKHSPHVGIFAVYYQMFIMSSTLGPAPKLTLRHEKSKKKKKKRLHSSPSIQNRIHQAGVIRPIIAVFYRCAELCLRLFFISS